MSTSGGQSGRVEAGKLTIVALTGFMGCGKTTVGREVAARLGWEFIDLDSVIESREKRTIREIFRTEGEAAFRAIEHATLDSALNESALPAVIALGGGAFVQSENAALLRQRRVPVVFLEVPIEELLRRCADEITEGGENARPLARDEQSFRRLYERRLPFYRRADHVVDAVVNDPAKIARQVVETLGLRSRE